MFERVPSTVVRRRAAALKALARPVRLRIVEAVESRRFTVAELASTLGDPQAVVEQRQSPARPVGPLTDERDGRSACHRTRAARAARPSRASADTTSDWSLP
jgi:hypothetical protein